MKIERFPATSRADWLAMRKRDVTASEVAALFGAHPYKTALQVYAEKTVAGKSQGDNAAMRRGRILEPGCIVALQELHPDWVIDKCPDYYRAADLRIGATPDYFRTVPADENFGLSAHAQIVECKTVSPEKWAEWQGGVPLAYQLQVVVQCKLVGASQGWIALLVDNRAKDFELFSVPAHEGAWQRIVAKVAEFWAAVEAGELPQADYAKDRAALAALMPPTSAEPVDLRGDNRIAMLLAERENAKAVAKDANELADRIDAEIIEKLAGHELATADGWKISHKMQTRKGFTVAAGEFPVLRISKTKEKAIA
jgi:putative phage-type endonuclease